MPFLPDPRFILVGLILDAMSNFTLLGCLELAKKFVVVVVVGGWVVGGGWVVVVLRPILVFSLGQAEQKYVFQPS